MPEIKAQWDIYKKLQAVRNGMNQNSLKKTGYNKNLNFNYFELGDFVPIATKLFYEYELCPIFSIGYDSNGVEVATLKVMSGPEYIMFTCPVERPAHMSGTQAIGAVVTYYRRYLYMMCLDLVENDQVDASITEENRNTTVETKKATAKQVELIRSLYDEENIAKMIEYFGIQSLEDLSMKDASAVIKKKTGK